MQVCNSNKGGTSSPTGVSQIQNSCKRTSKAAYVYKIISNEKNAKFIILIAEH